MTLTTPAPQHQPPAEGTGRFRSATGITGADVAVAATVVALVIVGTLNIDADAGERATDAVALACGTVAAVALVAWRRFGAVVLAVAAVTMAIYLGHNYPGGPALLTGPLALVALGYTASRRVSWIGAGVMAVVATGGHIVGQGGIDLTDLAILSWVLAAVLTGQALAARGERAAAERERQAHQHQQALARERLRIAQDLHDSVAHAMATINVQSGVAAHVMEQRPEQVRESLEAIRVASRSALDELGAILGFLRDAGAAPRSPLAGLDQLDDLVSRAEADGLTVTWGTTGGTEAVPLSIGSAAYRVVQEALTNTRRHAAPGPQVRITVTSSAAVQLQVEVRDDGGEVAALNPATGGSGIATEAPGGRVLDTAPGMGFGLVGMRERVESTGGVLEAGPTGARGFRVLATWKERA